METNLPKQLLVQPDGGKRATISSCKPNLTAVIVKIKSFLFLPEQPGSPAAD